MAVAFAASSAEAHDGPHLPSTVPSSAESAEVGVGVLAAHYWVPGYRTGEYVTLLPSLRVTAGKRWWAALVAPVHYLAFVGGQDIGLGDVMAALGYGFYRGAQTSLDAGLWTSWPVGNPHLSLGSGHLMLAPELDGAWHLENWVALGSLALRGAIPWGEHGLHNHQPLVAPHDLLDVRVVLSGGYRFWNVLELDARLEPVVVLIPHPIFPVGTRLVAGAEAVLGLGAWRVAVGFGAPVTINRAYEWQMNTELSVVL
jgi:hypothetical protein